MARRRAVLRALGGAAASASAGCGFPTAPLRAVPDPPAYARWLPLPDVGEYVAGLDDGVGRRLLVGAARPARVAERTTALLTEAGGRWARDDIVRAYLARRDLGLVDPRRVDRWVRVRSVAPAADPAAAVTVEAAVAGTFDPADAHRRALDSLATAPAGTHRGHDLVRWRNRREAAAFGDGRVVRATVSPPPEGDVVRAPTALLRRAVDVLAGERPPAHERDRGLARLLGHVGDGLAVRATRPPGPAFADLPGLVGWGAASPDVEGLRQRWAGTFDGAPPGDALERRLRSGYFIALDDVQRRDRAAVAHGRVDLPVWLA